MEITPYVATLRTELANAAELGGADARALAERLTAPMESAFRLALLDALAAATDEITRDLAPGSVQLRLSGREPTFVVTAAPADEPVAAPVTPLPPDGDDTAVSRINLRLPDQLKARIEEAAGREGLSVNAWLVRAASAAVQNSAAQRSAPRAPRGGQSFTGWVR
ncbi:MAG TPA: toxin-antitoxin system HicB family antitoxin [Actinoplanes sp.]|nr:toxin-antitoxin system HicB family antitoxin [Actinoplanes sp.]